MLRPAEMDVGMRISVIVVNFNGAHLLPDCLRSLQQQRRPAHEIIMVDNASVDDSYAVAAEHGARVVRLPANRGLAVAYNAGADIAIGDALFFVNNDMRFPADCLALLAAPLEADAGVFATDPTQLNWDGSAVVHAATTLRRTLPVFGMLPGVAVDFSLPAKAPYPVAWGCAGCLMVRATHFRALGGFDSSFFINFEDTDLCWRAWLRGWSTLYIPDAYLYHKVGMANDSALSASLKDRLASRPVPRINERRQVAVEKNRLRFIIKTMSVPYIAGTVLFTLTRIFRYVLLGRERELRFLGRALLWLIPELPAILAERRAILGASVTTSPALIRRFLRAPSPDSGSGCAHGRQQEYPAAMIERIN